MVRSFILTELCVRLQALGNLTEPVEDVLPLTLTRVYRPLDTRSRPFGIGATHPYQMFIVGDGTGYSYVELILADGGRIRYDRISPGTDLAGAVLEHSATPTQFYKSNLTWNWDYGWNLQFKDGSLWKFYSYGAGPVLISEAPKGTGPGDTRVDARPNLDEEFNKVRNPSPGNPNDPSSPPPEMPANNPSRWQQWKSGIAKLASAAGEIVKALGGTLNDFIVIATPRYILRDPHGRYGEGNIPEARLLRDSESDDKLKSDSNPVATVLPIDSKAGSVPRFSLSNELEVYFSKTVNDKLGAPFFNSDGLLHQPLTPSFPP